MALPGTPAANAREGYGNFDSMANSVSCSTRDVRALPALAWPWFPMPFDDGWVVRPMAEKDIDRVLHLYATYFSALHHTSRRMMLTRKWYETDVCKSDAEHERAKPYLVIVFCRPDGVITLATGMQMLPYERAYKLLATVAHPEHRGPLSKYYWPYMEEIARRGRIDIVQVTTAQGLERGALARKSGWKVGGIVPGEWVWSDGRRAYRDVLVHLYLLMPHALDYTTKESDWKMSPSLKEAARMLSKL
ncbi:N-acetyltransferase domain-containing protein [Plasmodiophora brassicae]